jgi:hypothetical protein
MNSDDRVDVQVLVGGNTAVAPCTGVDDDSRGPLAPRHFDNDVVAAGGQGLHVDWCEARIPPANDLAVHWDVLVPAGWGRRGGIAILCWASNHLHAGVV